MSPSEKFSLTDLLDPAQSRTPGDISPATYRKLARQIRDEPPALPVLNLLILSTFTTEFLDDFLTVESARVGLLLRTRHGGFAQFEQTLLGAEPATVPGEANALLMIMRAEDLDPDAVHRFHATAGRGFSETVDRWIEQVDACVEIFRRMDDGPVFVANLAPPTSGPFDASIITSLTHAVAAANRRLADTLAPLSGAHAWDYSGLVSARGSEQWVDPRLWMLARAPVASSHQPYLAAHLCRTLRATLFPAAKVLVLDLDNTLWGGAAGDDGVEGIEIGDDFPGFAFKEFQRAVLGLRDRGILIALSSKNNPEAVEKIFRDHPDMLIRDEHIAAQRINWNPKSQSLGEIAEELNVGMDSLVFFDDNPVERAEVRINAPEVFVVEVPSDPVRYVETLASLPVFDSPSVTAEDLGRAGEALAQRKRRSAEGAAGSLDEFLATLTMEAAFGRWDEQTAPRIAQLVAKTNQFNSTTRRHSPSVLARFSEGEGGVFWMRLRDRYGDFGIICVGILILDAPDVAVVESLIMSCRVANRGVEQAMVSYLAAQASAIGATQLQGEYLPTAKNQPVAELFPTLGFNQSETGDDGGRRFTFDLSQNRIAFPDTIRTTSA